MSPYITYSKLNRQCNSSMTNLLDKNGNKDKYYTSFIKFNKEEKETVINTLLNDVNKPEIKQEQVPDVIIKNINIQTPINNIGDLLQLIKDYPNSKSIKYNINMEALHNIEEPLIELNSMIGLQNIKTNLVDQILFYIQNLHKTNSTTTTDYMHTIINGPPGTGKTQIAKIIGKIFSKMGILNNNKFKKVTRCDLIAGFLGQTAIKTKDVIKECLGGVLFIDEAYSIGSSGKQDIFSKECIDTICESLSDHKDNLMVIIAGYELELEECFFSQNPGLKSRFSWKFRVNNYNSSELFKILLKLIKDSGWSVCVSESNGLKWIEPKMKYFPYFGRDIEILFSKIKISHAKRVFLKPEEKTILSMVDLEKGFEMFLSINGELQKPILNFYV